MLRIIAVSGCLAALLLGCADTRALPVIALPNGYYLTPGPNQETDLITRDGRRALQSPVAAYAVATQIVTGALGTAATPGHSYANDLPFRAGPDTRYFILDTRSGQLTSDLAASEWREKLDQLGVQKPFEIYAPLPWQ